LVTVNSPTIAARFHAGPSFFPLIRVESFLHYRVGDGFPLTSSRIPFSSFFFRLSGATVLSQRPKADQRWIAPEPSQTPIYPGLISGPPPCARRRVFFFLPVQGHSVSFIFFLLFPPIGSQGAGFSPSLFRRRQRLHLSARKKDPFP